MASVGFQLAFAGAARADTAAQPRIPLAEAREVGKEVFHLRQLHLQLALGGFRPGGKDIQDQQRAVDHAGFQLFLQHPLLHGVQSAVADHEIDLAVAAEQLRFGKLAAADEAHGVHGVQLLHDHAFHLAPRGIHKRLHLFHGGLVIVFICIYAQ